MHALLTLSSLSCVVVSFGSPVLCPPLRVFRCKVGTVVRDCMQNIDMHGLAGHSGCRGHCRGVPRYLGM